MADPLRVGVVGAGGWGTHVAEQFRDNPGASVAALADVDGASRDEAGDRLGVAPESRYADYEAMLDAERLDAVQITSPHDLHYDHAVAALERDLHVFCEKPFTPGVDRARDLVRRVEATDRVLMVGYQRHVHPAYVELRETIRRGDVEPKLVTAELTQGWIDAVEGTWRVEPDLSGGGQLYDSGSHLLDAVVWLLDDVPTRVTAEMAFADEDRRVDVQAALTVRFAGGTVASVAVSGDAPDVSERIAIRGDGGRGVLSGSGWTRRELTVTGADGTERASVAGDLSSYDKVDAFVRAVRDGDPVPATARDALRATALTEAAYESARGGEATSVDLSGADSR